MLFPVRNGIKSEKEEKAEPKVEMKEDDASSGEPSDDDECDAVEDADIRDVKYRLEILSNIEYWMWNQLKLNCKTFDVLQLAQSHQTSVLFRGKSWPRRTATCRWGASTGCLIQQLGWLWDSKRFQFHMYHYMLWLDEQVKSQGWTWSQSMPIPK